MTDPVDATIVSKGFAQLTTRELHDLLRLRVDVFVVEQQCPYPELDGRDTEPATEHLWVQVDGEPAAYLRVLADRDHDGDRVIGRVVTAPAHRGHRYAARLVQAALDRTDAAGVTVRLAAQSYLEGFYTGFGFVRTGPDFLDDGIAHLPMQRAPRPDRGEARP